MQRERERGVSAIFDRTIFNVSTFRITVTRETEHWIRYVGLSDFLVKTLIKPHKAVEIFGWMFLNGSDVSKLYLYRLPAKGVKVSGRHFWRKSVFLRITLEGKKYILHFKTSKWEKLIY